MRQGVALCAPVRNFELNWFIWGGGGSEPIFFDNLRHIRYTSCGFICTKIK